MATLVTRSRLRELLQEVLRTEADFGAFVLDYFPSVHVRFVGGMDRLSRTNLLLECVDVDDIVRLLIAYHPAVAQRIGAAEPTASRDHSGQDGTTALGSAHAHSQPRNTMRSKYLLHLSDLHFTDSSQALLWHTQLLLDLKNQMQVKELAGILISGDVTNHATTEQFGYAKEFIQLLCTTFKVQPKQLVVVPGNHDVSWNLTREGKNGAAPFCAFYQEICGELYPLDSAQQFKLHHFPELNLLTLGLNSAWNTDHANPKRAGLNAPAFSRAISKILEEDQYNSCTKLVLWHHPPDELSSEGGLDGGVLQQLAQAGFRLVGHGHIHRADNPSFRYYRGRSGDSLEILTAGTFGAPTKELVPGYPFQYQVLEFAGDVLTVHTRKREDVSGGWSPDHRWYQSATESPRSSYVIQLGLQPPPAERVTKQTEQSPTSVTSAREALVYGDGAPIHWVDREKQTRHLQELAKERMHHVVLVPGPQNEAHELFLTRLDQVLSHDPPHRSIWVHWPRPDTSQLPQFPTTQADAMTALTQALGGRRSSELPELLRNQLQDRDLLILHPVVSRDFFEADELLPDYYTRWLPDLFRGLQVPHCCMIVQPVSWQVARWLFGRKSPREKAYDFLHRVEAKAAQQLPVVLLHELEAIQRGDVIDFLRRYKYAGHLRSEADRALAREKFADKIMAGDATSEKILNQLSAELPESVEGSP